MACRVIKRLAAPVAMTNALPKGTVHYGGTIVGAKVTPTGINLLLALQQHHLSVQSLSPRFRQDTQVMRHCPATEVVAAV